MSKPLERLTQPRLQVVFQPTTERLLGMVLLCIALALFVPLPLSGWFPAIALFVAGIGFIERDGLVVLAGVGIGLAARVLTVFVAMSVAVGAEAVMH
ncbi:exopolysaccharide biosynthesis protein [Sulfitobacter sp. S0837]|nr:exopolysaccharide biosynthesis protein [Sulfitobacter maritimus]